MSRRSVAEDGFQAAGESRVEATEEFALLAGHFGPVRRLEGQSELVAGHCVPGIDLLGPGEGLDRAFVAARGAESYAEVIVRQVAAWIEPRGAGEFLDRSIDLPDLEPQGSALH